MKPANKCEYCKELRPLPQRLYELASFCGYLGNFVEYQVENQTLRASSEVIGNWLKLASQLDKVYINAWGFSGANSVYCPGREESDSAHFTMFSTAFTRFLFVTHALEETYRFVAPAYDRLANAHNGRKKKLKTASMKAAALLETAPGLAIPKHFGHLVANYDSILASYRRTYKIAMSGLDGVSSQSNSYGLHLVRILRNHVAHAAFPLAYNPDYEGSEGHRDLLIQLLLQSCRLAAIFIQIFVGNFNHGFLSSDYKELEYFDESEYEEFIASLTNSYAGALHLNGEFSLATAFD